MLKKLEQEALRADLAAIDALLAEHTPEADPVGHIQFSYRRNEIEGRLAELGAARPLASVGLFFGGRPVIGSRGVLADFGPKAVEQFQSVLTASVGADGGPQGTRGPVRQKDRSQLMITDVVRGSFGFVLEEASLEDQDEVDLQPKIDEIVDVIYRTSTGEQNAFEASVDDLDNRVLGSLKTFFKFLDDNGATVKLVENERTVSLTREDVARGRERTEALTINEDFHDFVGILYVLPDSKRFDLFDQRSDDVKRGSVAKDCLAAITNENGRVLDGIIGARKLVTLKVKEFVRRGRPSRYGYTLVDVRDPIE